MKDRIKILIAMLAGAVLVGGGTGAVLLSLPGPEPAQTTAVTTTEVMTTMEQTTATTPEETTAEPLPVTSPETAPATLPAATTVKIVEMPYRYESLDGSFKIFVMRVIRDLNFVEFDIDFSARTAKFEAKDIDGNPLLMGYNATIMSIEVPKVGNEIHLFASLGLDENNEFLPPEEIVIKLPD